MSFTCGGPPEPHSFKALKDIRIKGSCEASVQRDIDPVSRTTPSVLFPSGFSNICCSFKLWHIYQFTGLFKYMCTDAFKPLGVSIVVAFRWDISSWCIDSERDEQFIPIKLNIGVNAYVRCAIQMCNTDEHIWSSWCWFQFVLLDCCHPIKTEPLNVSIKNQLWAFLRCCGSCRTKSKFQKKINRKSRNLPAAVICFYGSCDMCDTMHIIILREQSVVCTQIQKSLS